MYFSKVPFREAHSLAGKCVLLAETHYDGDLTKLTLDELQNIRWFFIFQAFVSKIWACFKIIFWLHGIKVLSISVPAFSLTNRFFVCFCTAVIYSQKMSAVFGTLRTALNNISHMVELADPAFANRLKTWGRSKNKKKNLMIPVQKSCKSYLNSIVAKYSNIP